MSSNLVIQSTLQTFSDCANDLRRGVDLSFAQAQAGSRGAEKPEFHAAEQRVPLHVAILMDGNGRWATRRGLPREAGHRAGVQAVRRVVAAAVEENIATLSLFAFSSDNWRRPAREVANIMALIEHSLRFDTTRFASSGVRLTVIGRRDRLPPSLVTAIARAEAATAVGTRFHVRLALDYSARDAIFRGAEAFRCAEAATKPEFARLVSGEPALRDVDLVIRTGGEQRLSDFLLWEIAYAEILFFPRMWPEFDARDLADALTWFRSRERRFGGLGPSALTSNSKTGPTRPTVER